MKNNTIKYIFENRQPELRRLIVKYGLTPARSKNDLWKKVNYLITKFKQEMLFDIAKMHPDRDLILWASQQQQKLSQPILPQVPAVSSFNQEENSNACGCSSANGDDYSNMNCGMSAFSGDDYSNCNGNADCACNCKKSNVDGDTSNQSVSKVEVKATLANNMPLIVVGSLILVGGLIFLGSKA